VSFINYYPIFLPILAVSVLVGCTTIPDKDKDPAKNNLATFVKIKRVQGRLSWGWIRCSYLPMGRLYEFKRLAL